MILTLDTLGNRYGLLPSEVISRGNTFDLYVMDVSMSYHHYEQKRASGQYADNLSADDMMAMIKAARTQNG